jgi:two-component sensor histidine kinase
MKNEEPALSPLALRQGPAADGDLPASDGARVDAAVLADAPTTRRTEASEEKRCGSLEQELASAIALQKISTRLIREKDLDALYREIVAAAMTILASDFGSMQLFVPERNELYLLVSVNFHPDSAKFFEWVSCGEATACGMVLQSGERVIVPDIEACEMMAGTKELDHQRKCGMRAVQSTPLVSRDGESIGMISTHWKAPHAPSEEDLRLLDVLARQAADLIERTQAEARRMLLVNELNHRVKNTLAIVQAIAQQTFRGADVPEQARDDFDGRLQALAAAHNLLTRKQWEAANLDELVKGALTGCGALERTTVDGPPLRFAPNVAVTFAMALHELCTNASKYGALSKPDGRVHVRWVVSEEPRRRFHFEWRECDGPPVIPPASEGFGTRLIERALVRELHGRANLEYEPDGLRFTLDAPLPSERSEANSED